MSTRDHAALLCRVAGLREAANSGDLGGLPEINGLLNLDGEHLQQERQAIPNHVREAESFALQGACVKDTQARVGPVIGLFQSWLFNAGARRLGAEASWHDLLQPKHD